jgi:hypothetical protein
MEKDDNTDPKNKRRIRVVSFLISVVPASLAVSVTSFVGNIYLLGAVLFPCILIFSLTIIPVPVPAKVILTIGFCSFFISMAAIIYSLIVHYDTLRPYFPLL